MTNYSASRGIMYTSLPEADSDDRTDSRTRGVRVGGRRGRLSWLGGFRGFYAPFWSVLSRTAAVRLQR